MKTLHKFWLIARAFFRNIWRKLFGRKTQLEVVHEGLDKMIQDFKPNREHFRAVFKAVANIRGISGYEKKKFKRNFYTSFHWREPNYIIWFKENYVPKLP